MESTISVEDELFARDYNGPLVHQLVVSHLSNGRAGTRSQKSRGEVQASGRKPWRQKGTGRARAGTVASPIWRGGGKAFPSTPSENFKKKVNRKMFRVGISVILSQLVREGRLHCSEGFELEGAKTKLLAAKVKEMGLKSLLVVLDQEDLTLQLAARNLSYVLVITIAQLDPVSLLKFDNTVFTKAALKKFEENYKI